MLFDGYVERMVGERRREESGRWAVRVYEWDQLAKPSPA
jgi:hypothetical protein